MVEVFIIDHHTDIIACPIIPQITCDPDKACLFILGGLCADDRRYAFLLLRRICRGTIRSTSVSSPAVSSSPFPDVSQSMILPYGSVCTSGVSWLYTLLLIIKSTRERREPKHRTGRRTPLLVLHVIAPSIYRMEIYPPQTAMVLKKIYKISQT